MRTHLNLVDRSQEILQNGQAASGAFLACPSFPVYRYCWFRDGTFIANALDLYGDHASARRFYDWGVGIVRAHAADIAAACTVPVGEVPIRYLHTRYAPDGSQGNEDWPNFQLDGFGTFLWGLSEHLRMTGEPAAKTWKTAVDLLTGYLIHLWRSPNFDCWEEFPAQVHIATLAAIYGGLHAAVRHFDLHGVADAAEAIRAFVLEQACNGYLPKFVGSDTVDASLLWAAIPYGMFDPREPIMAHTIEKIASDLQGPEGGVHRYAADEYYGGGAWILLTAALGECLAALGDTEQVREILGWIERRAAPNGDLPEQVPIDLIRPSSHSAWVDRWGEIAQPLLWSHAAYLRLSHALDTHTAAERR